jgi:hypothetical protein
MDKNKKIRIGCASGFWGDTSTAAAQLVKSGKIDYLIFDFLAEVTMSILARAKLKNADLGYATDFVDQLAPLLEEIKNKNIKVLSNAGGINPEACRLALKKQADKLGITLNIAVISGDDLSQNLPNLKKQGVVDMDSGQPLPDSCLSVNAYLGAPALVKALEQEVDIVIVGRCVDSAMALAPLMYEFGWEETDYDLLASGSLAGHIIECGAQCTGGNFTDWEKVSGYENMGFPFVDVSRNGEFVVSKPKNTGGLVNFGTVSEQFLYEIGNPSEYILPDVVCDFTNVTINDLGSNRVLVKGAKGFQPTNQYKVSATHLDGYRVAGTLVIGGKDAPRKGEIIANAILKKTSAILEEQGLSPFTKTSYDLLGANSIYGPDDLDTNAKEIVLRVLARHPEKKALMILSKEMAQAVTGMPSGVINYLGGRPTVSPSINLFSFLYHKDSISLAVDFDNQSIPVKIQSADKAVRPPLNINTDDDNNATPETTTTTPLINLAYGRSGDKGDHANIGIIAREPHYLPYINDALTPDIISSIFSHVSRGDVFKWAVPGIHGLNFLLKNALGGGGMASLNIDPQGKAYAQQLLEYRIPISEKIQLELQKNE